jgi:hypothetical protein
LKSWEDLRRRFMEKVTRVTARNGEEL